jgi:hypothetical protein
LLNRDPYSAEAVSVSLAALDYGEEPWMVAWDASDVQSRAASVLTRLEPLQANERASRRLLQVLEK